MRHLLIAALLASPTLASAQGLPRQVVPGHCKLPGADKAAGQRGGGAQKLVDLPPAQQIKTVWRTDHRGCPQPVVVRDGIGGR